MVCLDLKIFVIQTYLKRCALGSQCPSFPVSKCLGVLVFLCLLSQLHGWGNKTHTKKDTEIWDGHDGTDGHTEAHKEVLPTKKCLFYYYNPFFIVSFFFFNIKL